MEDDKQAFTPKEVARLKKIAQDDERWEWLWTVLRRFGAWVFGIAAALAAFRDDIGRLLNLK